MSTKKVPDPFSFPLLLLGMGGLLIRKRK
ncbi:MAG: PEP-CTERM sorting domain-containing protein [Planctomycetota bacterium]